MIFANVIDIGTVYPKVILAGIIADKEYLIVFRAEAYCKKRILEGVQSRKLLQERNNGTYLEQKAGGSLPKIIGFLGSHPTDLCLYAAFVLQNMGRSVCVIDHSEDGVLFRSIASSDDPTVVVTYNHVEFIRKEPVVQWHELDYEYIFVQLGAEPQDLCLAACSERILAIDCERCHLEFYSRFMRETSMTMAVVVRGICRFGISAKEIKRQFMHENCFVETWMTLPLNEMDEAYRVGMQYELLEKFAHISIGMEKVLVQLLYMMEPSHPVKIIRAVHAAKHGREQYVQRVSQV